MSHNQAHKKVSTENPVPACSEMLCSAALAMLLAVVTKGDAYLSSPPRRVQWWGSLAEQPLPVSSLTRNSRNYSDRTCLRISFLTPEKGDLPWEESPRHEGCWIEASVVSLLLFLMSRRSCPFVTSPHTVGLRDLRLGG